MVLYVTGEIKAVSDIPLNFKILTISRNEGMHGKEVVFFFSCFLQFCFVIAANRLSWLTKLYIRQYKVQAFGCQSNLYILEQWVVGWIQ